MLIKNNIKQYKNKNIHIVGIGGAEGSAIAEFLFMNNVSNITGHDFSSKEDFRKVFYATHLGIRPKEREKTFNSLLNLPIKINFKENYLKEIEEADMVFVSQVWFKYPQNMPILENLKNKGIPFKTITNLYFELAPCRIISITGTNGKTTTSRIMYNIFEIWKSKNGGKSKVYFAGNDRQNIQVLDKLPEMKKNDVLILETSSTQLLLNSKISPHIGVITNITPNHIDDHKSFENYIEAKKNLIKYQKENDFAVLNYDNKITRAISKEFENTAFLFSAKKELKKGCFIKNDKIIVRKNDKETVLFSKERIKLRGAHNIENVLAASSAAYLFGIKKETIKKGVSKYKRIKHRLDIIYKSKNIKFYDDTQATTPEATISALSAFDGENIILFAGGDNKGMIYDNLAEEINEKVKFLVLFPGSASDEIEKLIDKEKINFARVKKFQEAVDFFIDYYKKNKTLLEKSCVVLVSPAAAHFYSKCIESSGKTLRWFARQMI